MSRERRRRRLAYPVRRLKEIGLNLMSPFVNALPFGWDRIVGLTNPHAIVVVGPVTPLLGVEHSVCVPVDHAQVVGDLVRAHFVERADIDEDVCLQAREGL